MLTYDETYSMILSLERSIKDAEKEAENGNIEQRDYALHCSRLLQHYIIEHRRAARRDGNHAMR